MLLVGTVRISKSCRFQICIHGKSNTGDVYSRFAMSHKMLFGSIFAHRHYGFSIGPNECVGW